MLHKKLVLSVLTFNFIFFISCSQNVDIDNKVDQVPKSESTKVAEKTKPKNKGMHPYGGWYCPDNFGGFPPVDIQDLDKVPVVNDRLPTKEEASNGTSLMFIDIAEFPDAKPLEMKLPRVARVYTSHSDMYELAIVIQAVIIDNDTVVG